MLTTIYGPDNETPIQISVPDASVLYAWTRTVEGEKGHDVLHIGLKYESETVPDVRKRLVALGCDQGSIQEIERTCMRAEVWGVPDKLATAMTLSFMMFEREKLPAALASLLSKPGVVPSIIPTSEEVLKQSELYIKGLLPEVYKETGEIS